MVGFLTRLKYSTLVRTCAIYPSNLLYTKPTKPPKENKSLCKTPVMLRNQSTSTKISDRKTLGKCREWNENIFLKVKVVFLKMKLCVVPLNMKRNNSFS